MSFMLVSGRVCFKGLLQSTKNSRRTSSLRVFQEQLKGPSSSLVWMFELYDILMRKFLCIWNPVFTGQDVLGPSVIPNGTDYA